MIPAGDLVKLPASKRLVVERTRHGGHCGFFEDYGLESWAVSRMGEVFSRPEADGCS